MMSVQKVSVFVFSHQQRTSKFLERGMVDRLYYKHTIHAYSFHGDSSSRSPSLSSAFTTVTMRVHGHFLI